MHPGSSLLWIDPDFDDNRREWREAVPGSTSVHSVETTTAALEHLDERPFDCLITEYHLPDSDGIDLFGRARKRCPTVAGVLFTAHGSERTASDAIAAGFNAYVAKSDGLDLLAERMADVLELGTVSTPVTANAPADAGDVSPIVRESPLGIIKWRPDLTVEEWNPAAQQIFGYSHEEAVGRHATELVVPEDVEWTVTQGWNRLLETGAASRRINENVRKDGSHITCEWFNVPLEDDEETVCVLSYVQDVTAEQRRRQHLQVFNRILRHDLRNCLNLIRGATEQLAGEGGSDDAREMVDMVYERTGELIALADKTRTIERLTETDAGALTTRDLASVTERAVDRVLDLYPKATADVSVPDTAPARAHDVVPIGIEELIKNAIEHTPEPSTTVMVQVVENDETVTVSVADEGPGIPEEERQLFERDQEITQLNHSSGVGLWIVYWAVRASNGKLSFDIDDSGSVVEVTLPGA